MHNTVLLLESVALQESQRWRDPDNELQAVLHFLQYNSEGRSLSLTTPTTVGDRTESIGEQLVSTGCLKGLSHQIRFA